MGKTIKIGTCSSCKTEGTLYIDTGLCMCCDKRDRTPKKTAYERASEILNICAMNAIQLEKYAGEVKLSNDECLDLSWDNPFTLDEIKTAFWDNKT